MAGSATAQINGSQLTINTSQNAVLNWQSFNIGSGERTVFNQPSSSSIVFNQIGGQSASQIYGSLQANGIVVLLNSSGFYFGPGAYVSAAGLVVSTANYAPPQNGTGAWQFNGPPPLASIVNYGQIKIGNGGDCFFIGDKIENHGDIIAPGGSIQFAAGQTVTLSERPDGRGMSMAVTLPQGSVDNYGNVIADGGTIAMHAKVVNQDGFVQANSVRNVNGVIELVADDALNLGANSVISANGDNAAGSSAGGDITLKSGNVFNDTTGSEILIKGGANGGNGGAVEISAPKMAAVNSKIDGTAKAGSKGGRLTLDPDFIVLDQSGTDSAGSGTVGVGDASGSTLYFDVNSRFTGLSDITLQAAYDILFADGTVWDLSASTGQSSGSLTLEAGRNIIFGNTTALKDTADWSFNLYAGVTDFGTPKVSPGAGSILLNAFDPNNPVEASDPSGYIQTGTGHINLIAGQDITVGIGRVTTTAGGSITAHALAGNIDTGGYAQGYVFQTGNSAAEGYYVDTDRYVGGISTVAGGDVNLIAGGNIQSLLPGKDGYFYDGNFTAARGNPDVTTAGSGAYGKAAEGNVTLVAGGNITGHYIEANGNGKIYAGVQMDSDGNPIAAGNGYLLGNSGSAGTEASQPNFALSLIKGGWNVKAAQNIILQEVRNPNGMFNTQGSRTTGSFHAFDYSEDAFVKLNAGNMVQLGGKESLLPRLTANDGLKPPVLFPGILNIVAGAGGVVLTGDPTYNKLILFPSKKGSLTILTTAGGSLVGSLPAIGGIPQIFNLIMSDSGRTQYNPRSSSSDFFGLSDHASTPVHYGNETDFNLDIAGNMNYMFIGAPEKATITVHGDMNNSRFQGMNLAPTDITSINVTGDINNRGAFTSVDLSAVVGASVGDLSLLGRAIVAPGDPVPATLASSFIYDPQTHLLTYQNITGKSLANVLNLLQHLTVQVYVNGVAQWEDAFQTIPKTEVVSVINSAAANALLTKYNALGTPPSGANGYAIGGGGKFEINAHNLDLGTTAGIQSWGGGLYTTPVLNPGDNPNPLAKYFNTGADILVNLTGDLNMFSTAIASFNGGDIYVNAAHDVNVGSSDFTVTSLGARGIFATGLGNVSVYAGHDINVEGSRIAVYDTRPLTAANSLIPSGNVTVVSRGGDVVVGSGGSGFVVVNSFYTDPLTHLLTGQTPTIPGTGILQTSFNLTGNVLVEALMGNVSIGAGGVSQVLFKGNKTELDTVGLKHLLALALEAKDKEAAAFQTIFNGVIPGAHTPVASVYAGYGLQQLDAGQNPILDAYGNPLITAENLETGTLVQSGNGNDIDASGSGIVGAGTANLKASGGITGNIFSLGDVNLDANKNINVNVFGLGNVSVASAGGTISGTIIGVGGISASGGSIDANLESNGSISGETSGNAGFAQSQSAGNVAAGAGNDAANDVKKTEDKGDDELNKKKKPIALAQKVSRVTVLLPKKD